MMKLLIAGATGAIGLPVVKEALLQGYEVFAMSHSEDKHGMLSEWGAIPLKVNVFDASEVLSTLQKVKPEVILNMLSSLPKTYTPEAMSIAMKNDEKVRREGSTHLLHAATMVGVKRYIMPAGAYWYAPGEGVAEEKTSYAFKGSPMIAEGVKLFAELEGQLEKIKNLEGVVLRYGFFYGPGTWYTKEGDMAIQARQKQLPMIEGSNSFWNFVHIEDAAKATVAAIQGFPGIYNINDDDPVEMNHWLSAFCQWVGAPKPSLLSKEEYLKIRGEDALYYATRLRGASNAKAKKTLGFKPRKLEWLCS